MRTLDPSIRQAAQRVTAWHVARWQAHIEPSEPSAPDDLSAAASDLPSLGNPDPQSQTSPARDSPPERIS